MFKAGKCQETKISEILHNMVVTKFERRVVSFDARKQTHKGASFVTSSLFSYVLHNTQRVLFCNKLCSLKLLVKYAALSISVTDLDVKVFCDMNSCHLLISYRQLGNFVLLQNTC